MKICKSGERFLYEKEICKYIFEMMNLPICICEDNAEIKVEYFNLIKEWRRIYRNKEFVMSLINLKDQDYPVIRIDENGIFHAIIYSKKSKKIFIIGPVIVGEVTRSTLKQMQEKYVKETDHSVNWPICSYKQYMAGIQLLTMLLLEKKLSEEEIWEHNKSTYESVTNINKSISLEFFARNENAGKHNPYEQELREMESIENGDENTLRKSISEVYEGQIGILAKNPLRHHKNVAIGNVTLASRAAIKGGVDAEISFSMADIFIRQIEAMTSISEIEEYKKEMKIQYAKQVKAGKENGRSDINPLIREVKNYIFTHMHEAIKIVEVARQFNVNPDYLSHLFSVHEKMTFRHYVLNEKIDRSKNLLKYSDYKIQEIGFYLGFSSQSHYTKVFKDFTGMKPSEYRKAYGNQTEWKSQN